MTIAVGMYAASTEPGSTHAEGGAGRGGASIPSREDTRPDAIAQKTAAADGGDYRQKLGDPGALGLLAFGMTTIMFTLSTSGLTPMNTTTAGMVICYGGCTQVLVGIMEFVRGNSFGCTIATTFGAFWVATAFVWLLPRRLTEDSHEYLREADDGFMGAFFLIWAVFTLTMSAASLKGPLMCSFTLFLAGLSFFLQSIAFWARSDAMKIVGAYDGLLCGISAMYCGLALTVNMNYERNILPLFAFRNGRVVW